MLFRSFSTIVLLLLLSVQTNAQNRHDKPIQIHLNASGVFLKTVGPLLADPEVDQLDVNRWIMPGVSIGYHLSPRIYLGYSFQPNRKLTLHEPWTFGNGAPDGNIRVFHNNGHSHALEARYFPFDFGLYLSGGLLFVSKAPYELYFDKTGDQMAVGDSTYATDLTAGWNFRAMTTVGAGLGYNYVHHSGFSFSLGLMIPVPLASPLYRDIAIGTSGESLSEESFIDAVDKIENELFYYPVQFHVGLGFNF